MTNKAGLATRNGKAQSKTGDAEKRMWARIVALLTQYLKILSQKADRARGPVRQAHRIARVSYLAMVKAQSEGDWATIQKAQRLARRNRDAWRKARTVYLYWANRADDARWQLERAQKAYASGEASNVYCLDAPVFNSDGKIKLDGGTSSIQSQEYRTRLGDIQASRVKGLAVQTTSLTHLRLSSIRTVAKTLGQYANAKALMGHQLRPIESLGLSSASPLLFWQIGELHRRLLSQKQNKTLNRAEYEKAFGYPVRAGKAQKVLAQCQSLMPEGDYYIDQIDTIAKAIHTGNVPPQMGLADIYSFDEIEILTGIRPDGIQGAQKAMRDYRAKARKVNGQAYVPAPKPGPVPMWSQSQSKLGWPNPVPSLIGPVGPFVVVPHKCHASAPKLVVQAQSRGDVLDNWSHLALDDRA